MHRLHLIFLAVLLIVISPALLRAQQQLIKSVYFGGGSYGLSGAQVQEIADFIQGVPDMGNYEVQVSSHTDNIGSLEYNQWLSENRSRRVIRELKALGIGEDRILLRDNGEQAPLYDNRSQSGRSANRRVDIILVPVFM